MAQVVHLRENRLIRQLQRVVIHGTTKIITKVMMLAAVATLPVVAVALVVEQELHFRAVGHIGSGSQADVARYLSRGCPLGEWERLRQLEQNLVARAQDIPGTSRPRRQLFSAADVGFYQVLCTPMQNLSAVAQIMDTFQPPSSAAQIIRHVQALQKAALE